MQDLKERSAELVCHNSRWVVFEAGSLLTTLWQYCTWFLTFWSDATPILCKKFKAVWLSHFDDYCTIMIGAGSTKEFQRIGLIMLKYGFSLMEHFSTSTSFFLCVVRLTGCGFHGCFFFNLFSRCRYEVCLFLKLCSFQVNVWHKYKPKHSELNTETHVTDVRTNSGKLSVTRLRP